jgi:hypothetical protein
MFGDFRLETKTPILSFLREQPPSFYGGLRDGMAKVISFKANREITYVPLEQLSRDPITSGHNYLQELTLSLPNRDQKTL